MERIWTTELGRHIGERVRLAGWLHQLRELKQLTFLVLRDAKGLAQIVVDDPGLIEQLVSVHNESVLEVEGQVVAEPQAPGGVELHQPRVKVLVPVSYSLPFDLYRPEIKAQLPGLLDHAPVALRHPHQRAFFQLAAASMQGFRSTLR